MKVNVTAAAIAAACPFILRMYIIFAFNFTVDFFLHEWIYAACLLLTILQVARFTDFFCAVVGLFFRKYNNACRRSARRYFLKWFIQFAVAASADGVWTFTDYVTRFFYSLVKKKTCQFDYKEGFGWHFPLRNSWLIPRRRHAKGPRRM